MSMSQPLEQKRTKKHSSHLFFLTVYNDDVNTFDHVIESLVEICGHELTQATQCTYIIHYKGSCAVKEGTFENLSSLQKQLLSKGLSAGLST